MKIHAGHIEVAVARLLNWRLYTIVPNVSWGLGLSHECDMLALDAEGRFTEIEIKVTASDLKRDFLKPHGHCGKYISRLVYAMPETLCEKYADIVPRRCGIISVTTANGKHENPIPKAAWWRQARHAQMEKPPPKTVAKFMALGCMRIWTLKEHCFRQRQRQTQ